MMRRKRSDPGLWTRGNANIEFALCAIFMVFLLISIFDMARGLWIQHTLTEAVRDGARFAIVRGFGYAYPDGTRPADGKLRAVRDTVVREAVGLVPSQMALVFQISAGTPTCTPSTPASCISTVTCSRADTDGCTGGSLEDWWPGAAGEAGLEVAITAHYPYNSMVVMYFPGGKGINFGQYVLGSTARERIVF